MAETVSQEIGDGIILHKRVVPSYTNYEILDQTNIYSIESKQDKDVEIVVDITGSDGVAFESTYATTKTARVKPFGFEEVASVKLFGDWLLRIKFTYTIKNFGKGSAAPKSLASKVGTNAHDLPSQIQGCFEIFEFFPYDIMPLDAIRRKLKENGTNFVDIEFPPVESSIYPASEGKPFGEIVWKRPKEFMMAEDGPMEVFDKKIEPNDIKQGQLGDCWFMCALASLAEMPYLVERLFITQKYNEEGLYRLKLCKNGEWIEVTVDDYFPCSVDGGPIFSRSNGNELWVLLLEKAYAKLHGNYYTLRGGFANEGMMDLTGSPTECFDFEDPACQEQINKGEFFKKMKQFDEAGYLISSSTAGEDRWTETGGPTESGGLVPGHAYSVIQVKEAHGNQLVNIRNPWGAFEWEGEWADNHKKWTQQMINAIKPVFGDDGTFWMSFQDFSKHFRALNVCKVSDWEEVRVKGELTSKLSEFDSQVRSRFYYEIQVSQKQRVLIGIHQEDERIQDLIKRKPYIAIGVAIMQKNSKGGLDLIFMKEFSAERQVELDVELDAGEYIILPRTSGCTLKRPMGAKAEYIKLLDGNGDLNPLADLCIKDIFRRLDKVMINNILEYSEFQEFYSRMNIQLTEQEFRQNILKRFCNNDQGGINRRGLCEFWKDAIRTQGEPAVMRWLEKWGYDKDLYPCESRCFMLTIHSMKPIAIQIEEASTKKDYDDLVNKMILEKFAEEVESKPNVYRLLQKFSELSYTFSYGVENTGQRAIDVTLDCTSSKNMVFSEPHGKIQKVVEPGAIEFMMHAEASPGAEEFAKGATCTYKEVY